MERYEKASAKHDKLEAEIARRNNKARQLASFIDHLEKAPASLEEWDSQVWSLLLGDVADLLRSEIKRYMDARGISHALKYIDPSYIIRSVPATANDKVYCGFLGQYAVHAAMAGRTDMVVGKIQDRYVHLPLELVTRRRRKLNIYSDLWRAALEST